jgi:hypothetical protein
MLAVLGGLADLIRTRALLTVVFPPFTLRSIARVGHALLAALNDCGHSVGGCATLSELASSYDVSMSTISRLTASAADSTSRRA